VVYQGGRLAHPATGSRPTALTALVHDELRALVLNEHFTCVGAKAALRHGTYRFGLYGELGSRAATAGLAYDLFTYARDLPSPDALFTTYLASFVGPTAPDETTFEHLLWATLQQLADLDAPHHRWARSASSDPADARFAFSFAGVAFFVVGLHAASSRVARRFAWPTLVFNPHVQFEDLKNSGRYARFQQIIRAAEETLQGDVNPMLSDFGSGSEAVQYSGRRVGADWKCPFHAHDDPEPD